MPLQEQIINLNLMADNTWSLNGWCRWAGLVCHEEKVIWLERRGWRLIGSFKLGWLLIGSSLAPLYQAWNQSRFIVKAAFTLQPRPACLEPYPRPKLLQGISTWFPFDAIWSEPYPFAQHLFFMSQALHNTIRRCTDHSISVPLRPNFAQSLKHPNGRVCTSRVVHRPYWSVHGRTASPYLCTLAHLLLNTLLSLS